MSVASDQRAKAYMLLGVSANTVASSPKIGPLLKKVEGGKQAALEALRASDLPEARHFISKYDNILLPSYVRRILPMEAFAVAAGISPTRLFGVIAEVIRTQKAQLGAIKAAQRHEAIVEVSSLAALHMDGVDDRMAHLKHMGFTPSPKGSTINIGINASATAQSASQSASAALPSAEDTIRRIVEARQRASLPPAENRALPEASESVPVFMPQAAREAVTIEGEYEDD